MALETFPVELAPFYESEEAQEELLNDVLASGHAGYMPMRSASSPARAACPASPPKPA